MAKQISPDMLEAIKKRPLFNESRRSRGNEPVSETSTILIDGSYTTVELIGTIESTDKQIAAFALGGQSTVWIQRDDYLGDWQVKEITQHRVRLGNDIEVRLMEMRKTVAVATHAAED